MTALGQSIGIGGDYGTEDIQILHYGIWTSRRILNRACISISNLPGNIAWQTHKDDLRPEAQGPLKSGAWGGRPTCHPQTPPLHRPLITIFQNTFSRIPLIWHARDPTGAGLWNIPDYQTQPIIAYIFQVICCYCSYILACTTNRGMWCDFDRASSLICANKMPARCHRIFYCISHCLLNMFQAPLCPETTVFERLMKDIVVSETCWASNNICNKNLCCI